MLVFLTTHTDLSWAFWSLRVCLIILVLCILQLSSVILSVSKYLIGDPLLAWFVRFNNLVWNYYLILLTWIIQINHRLDSILAFYFQRKRFVFGILILSYQKTFLLCDSWAIFVSWKFKFWLLTFFVLIKMFVRSRQEEINFLSSGDWFQRGWNFTRTCPGWPSADSGLRWFTSGLSNDLRYSLLIACWQIPSS